MVDDPLDIEPPGTGRIFGHRRRVNLGDVSPNGRARFDALSRMLQDVSDEDTCDAEFPPNEGWVVRRSDIGVTTFPVFREWIDVATWCSGVGSRWAERRVRIEGDKGGRVDAAVLWVHLDPSGRPARLPDRFDGLFGEAARGRKVRARLHHDTRPDDLDLEPWDLRFCDFDVMDHVNNAISWVPVEEARAARGGFDAPVRASVEHPAPIDIGAKPMIGFRDVADGFDLWVVDGDATCSTAQLRVQRT